MWGGWVGEDGGSEVFLAAEGDGCSDDAPFLHRDVVEAVDQVSE